MQSSATFVLKNTGTTPVSVVFDKKYFFSYGITVEPERINKLPMNESAQITITYIPAPDLAVGQQHFLLPLIFKSNSIGFIHMRVNISTPTIKITNLLNLAGNFRKIPIKQGDCQILHFGECFFGRRLKFGLNISNPT